MIEQPTLETQRLRLRPLELTDASIIQQAADDRNIADTMISIPHPYPAGEGERYVNRKLSERNMGRSAAFAIEHKEAGSFYGLVEVRDMDREHLQAELSFWRIVDVWGQGYMTEVVRQVVRYAFEDLCLNRLYAYHMMRNPATGRLLEKNGFKQEGLLHQRVRKWGQFEDVLLWAILRQEVGPAGEPAC